MMGAFVYAAVFLALCAGLLWFLGRRGPLWVSAGVVLCNVVFLKVVFSGIRIGPDESVVTVPGIAMLAMKSATPLPVPSFAFWSYMLLTAVGIVVVVGASDAMLADFSQPILRFLRGDETRRSPLRLAVLYGLVPLLAGWIAFSATRPSVSAPLEARQAHPSISYDEDLVNPYRTVPLDPAVLQEGRDLYAKNCAPCHSGKADGTGLMAQSLRLPPANFTDMGTIATLVEGYAFKRIQGGGIGLPTAGTPWDSAMPRWEDELSDDEIYKILIAEYDLAGVSPRVPEETE